MGTSIPFTYFLSLIFIGLLLLGFYVIVKALSRGRLFAGVDRRLVSVVDSTVLAQNTALHIVKIGSKYYAVGGGSGHLSMLCEVPPEEVGSWLESQRALFGQQTRPIAGLLGALRRPPQ